MKIKKSSIFIEKESEQLDLEEKELQKIQIGQINKLKGITEDELIHICDEEIPETDNS
jgi:hypothetical protein